MPGIATKFVVADKVFKRLAEQGWPEAKLLQDAENRKYACLGAVGAALGDFIAARPEIGGRDPNSKYIQTWLPVLRMFTGTPAAGSAPGTRGIYRDVKQLRDTLGKLQRIVDKARQGNVIDKDVAKLELLGMKDELEDLPNAANDIRTIVATLGALRVTIGASIFTGASSEKVAPSNAWAARDTLHASRTGRFLGNLRKFAEAGDDRQKAYALGASIGYSTDLCGNPFINSIVGSPYRTHWWRHRWISNYVDTWVWGYYSAGGSEQVSIPGVVPSPLYTTWPNVCEAQLHKRIDLGFSLDEILAAIRDGKPLPSVVPPTFIDFWMKAYVETYGAPPSGGVPDRAALDSAFAMLWSILWLQTSAEAIPCVPVDQINYPDGCGARPPWVAADGSVATGGSSSATPPPASRSTHPSIAEVISGIVLAIIGVINILTGNVIGGIAAIVGAVALIADGVTDPDWDELHCYTGWVFAYMYNMTNALHELMKWSGLGFPYTQELTHNDIALVNTGVVTPPDAAINTVRSRGPSDLYPASAWEVSIQNPQSNWANFPAEAPEQPGETAYPIPSGNTWPFHFVDGLIPTGTGGAPQVNELFNLPGRPPLVRDEIEYAARLANLNVQHSTGTFFGNAVEVSVQLITKTAPEQLLDWDLDADPGIGYPTWTLPGAGAPRSTSIPET